MARQEQIFAETIVAMKKATARKDDVSDSDESIRRSTNRGNKLKRKARYAEPGRLDTTDGSRRRRILYNGYSRTILINNPPRVDADGDVIDQPQDEDSDGALTPAEDDPFAEIQLQDLLMPLTSAAGLKQHPSLSVPYTSRALEQMIQSVQDMLHREQEALWRLKQLTSELRGDQTWLPCGAFETENDGFTLAQFPMIISQAPSAALSLPSTIEAAEAESVRPLSAAANWDTMSNVRLMADIEKASLDGIASDLEHDAYKAPEPSKEQNTMSGTTDTIPEPEPEQPTTSITSDERANRSASVPEVGEGQEQEQDCVSVGISSHQVVTNGSASEVKSPVPEKIEPTPSIEPILAEESNLSEHANNLPTDVVDTKMEDVSAEGVEEPDDSSQPTHRMTTRNQARAAEAPSTPSSRSVPSSPPLSPIHPFFLVPISVRPDSSVGLPHEQANETRRLLIAYVQRQEEVCRGVSTLYTGLLKAKKMRDDVLEWSNAEGHIGELSDGEDWIDLDQWGLEAGDLRKGEEVEEEEEQGRAGKKTRNRRQVA